MYARSSEARKPFPVACPKKREESRLCTLCGGLMLTVLDSQSWAKELVTGNGAFVQQVNGTLFVVSNLRPFTNDFVILKSDPVPAPGPGSSFSQVASYHFPNASIDFDPVVAYDANAGLIHIVGTRNNPVDATLSDLVKFTFDTGSNALTGPVVLVTGSRVRDAYDVCVLDSISAPWTVMVAVAVDEPTSYDPNGVNFTPTPGMNLVAFELDESDTVGQIAELVTSPSRAGNTFSSVSLVSPDGVSVELYYEYHPKLLTFNDQLFTIAQFNRDVLGDWGSSVDVTNFQGRFTDDRLTVLADGNTRWLSQVYFNQLSYPRVGLVGNSVFGYFDSAVWTFHTVPGSVLGGSIIQSALSLDAAHDMSVVYLLEPFDSPATAWPLRIATLDTTLRFTDVPGYYNTENFTWIRGTKSFVDPTSRWAITGERLPTTYPTDPILPVYFSLFNVPPVVSMTPTSATVYRGGAGYNIGAGLVSGDLSLDASATFDTDQNALQFIWSVSDVDSNITLTPNGPSSSSHATLDVSRAVGGASLTFRVGVAVVDLATDLTPIHPSMNVTSVEVVGSVLTVVAANSLANGEQVMLYGLGLPDFDDRVVTVDTSNGSQFTVNPYTTPNTFPLTAVTGFAIAQFQFKSCDITVPVNDAPVISWTPLSTQARGATVTLVPVITHAADVDDLTTYSWVQLTGSSMTFLGGTAQATLQFKALGTDVHGETLTFSLTVNDGVNPPVTNSSFSITVAPYVTDWTTLDTLALNRAVWPGTIAQRNTPLSWGSLMPSAMLTDLESVKRTSVLDGSDRYLLFSTYSVLVYGGINPFLFLLRKLLTPAKTAIMDCVHTEQDYTLVLDDQNMLFRYSTAPLITTDNPDTTIVLTTISSFAFNKIFTTPAFADQRILVLSGPDGLLLLQVVSSTLQVLASFELSTENGFIYGSNNVQFVRTNNVESLREGKVLIGSIVPDVAHITKMRLVSNDLLVTAANDFKVGTKIQFSGTFSGGLVDIDKNATVLGRDLVVTQANATSFQCSVLHADAGTGPNYTETGTATATNQGTTYETLVSLANNQITGTWDASKTRNQYVETGEILFELESSYVGRPQAPTNVVLSAVGTTVTITWVQERPDLVSSYNVEFSTNGGTTYSLLQRINSGAVQQLVADLTPGLTYKFRIQAFSQDGASNYSIPVTITI